MRFDDLLREIHEQAGSVSSVARQFMDTKVVRHRYAVGKNDDTLALHSLIGLAGIIDDFSATGNRWNGIPLVRAADVPYDALVANCSTSISPVAVLDHLASIGLANVVGLHELIPASAGKLAWPKFVQVMHRELETEYEAWRNIYDNLADSESRQTFIDVVRYRSTANPDYMRRYRVRIQEQYFEDFMNFKNEIFVDAGGFDGDTTEAFADRYVDYQRIHFFEPSETNMLAARKRLTGRQRIEFYPIGLSDAAGVLHFNQDAGSASSVSDIGGDAITVDTLDALVQEPVSFIKMDLEGWEQKALHGAKGHIRADHPKMAIAVYHDSADFRLIYQLIEQFGVKYQIFLRHYTQGWSETIMFFLPQE